MDPNVLIIDNNDSFTYNLVQIIRESELCRFTVRRCKDISLDEISVYDKILISPGAGVPSDYPILRQIILRYKTGKSILGVCLGHQAIAEAFGLELFNMGQVYHGIRSKISLTKNSGYLYEGIPRQFYAGLYHSWAVSSNNPDIFKVNAKNSNGIIMGLAHIDYDIQGVQFHPESYMTEYGEIIITNWVKKKLFIGEVPSPG
jgi:anthranilate synthase/aminodeoxychorismate synthase-like glutamine amidotransferase